MNRNDPTICVVGGGITGLAAAWELATTGPPRPRVVVLESEPRVGGKLRTTELGHRQVDLGPDAFLARRDEAVSLCREIGLGDDLVTPGATRSFVWARGRLRPLPSGLALGVPTRLLPLARSGICSPIGLWRAALDLLSPPKTHRRREVLREDTGDLHELPEDRSVGSVVRRRLGSEVHDLLADPLIGGIHAGGIDTMSAASVFPQLLEADSRSGSLMRALRLQLHVPLRAQPRSERPVFMTVRGGLERLTERLRAALVERGVDIRRGTAAFSLDPGSSSGEPARWSIAARGGRVDCDGVVVCTPAPEASRLAGQVDGSLTALLEKIPYASVTLVTLRVPRTSLEADLDGTGFLVPAAEGRLLTACTWLSSKWPELDRPDDVLLRASMGRFGDDRAEQMTDEEVLSRTLEELGQLLSLRDKPLDALVTRWPRAFPQYLVGHARLVRSVEAISSAHPGLAFAGAALHGIGIPACIGSGRRAAQKVLHTVATGQRVTG